MGSTLEMAHSPLEVDQALSFSLFLDNFPLLVSLIETSWHVPFIVSP